jgi:hypothetical protein
LTLDPNEAQLEGFLLAARYTFPGRGRSDTRNFLAGTVQAKRVSECAPLPIIGV